MKTRQRSIAAFSLVELTIALGVITFCLLVIIGLLAIGINSTHSSTTQTAATNLLTAVTSDLEAVPNITPSFNTTFNSAKGTVTTPGGSGRGSGVSGSPVYGLTLPAGGSGGTTNIIFYVAENGITNASPSSCLYRVNIWITAANSASNHQETFARILISWPAAAPYTTAQGYVENVVAINRT
jgi:hypothetical protein